MGYWQVEAAGPPGCLRVVAFHPAEDDQGLDIAAPIVVEGEVVVIRRCSTVTWPASFAHCSRHARDFRAGQSHSRNTANVDLPALQSWPTFPLRLHRGLSLFGGKGPTIQQIVSPLALRPPHDPPIDLPALEL